MPRFTRTLLLVGLLLVFGISSAMANSNPDAILLDFAGLQNMQAVGNTYSGVSFSSNFFALRSVDRNGSGGFAPGPLGTPIVFINGPTGSMTTGTINVPGGFNTGLQFFYTAGFSETVTIWSGNNGTGVVLATLALLPNNLPCTGFPSYCNWSSASLTLGSGTGKSITFTGPANGLGIADITLNGTTSAIPEPSSFYLVITGLAVASLFGLRRLFSN